MSSAPTAQTISTRVPAVATAGNDLSTTIGRAPFAGTVSAVTYIPDAALTGANTNSRTLQLRNRAQDGTGTTAVASLALTAGSNLVAFDESTLTLSGTPANLNVASGDVLEFFSQHIGTGITDPGGLVTVTITRGNVAA